MKRILGIGIFILSVFLVNAQDAADQINSANEALKAKEYAKAFDLYDGAMKNLGDIEVDASINYNIGFAAYKAKKYAEAVSYFDKAIEVGTNEAKAWEYKANAYNKLKDYGNAIAGFEKAAELSESGSDALIYNAAFAAYNYKKYDKAVELFTKCVDAGYKGAGSQYYKAVVLKKQNKDAEYKQALEVGAEKFPGNKKIGSALSKLYVSEGNSLYKKGVAVLNAANEKVNSGDLTTADSAYSAEVEKAKTEFKAAATVLESAAKLDPTNANATKLLEACKQNLSI